MTDDGARHAFISYVKEDKDHVDKLCRVLDAAQIPYWRDRKDLAPGDAWRQKIRDAIRSGSVTFLACFSDSSRARETSYMNEELTLAVEEFRLRPPGATWLIPVRFDDGQVPFWDLGAGRTLDDLNYADLFGDSYSENAAGLIATMNRLVGLGVSSPATLRAALDEAVGERRGALMAKLTKEMLANQSRRIELDDLIGQETRTILRTMKDDERFSASSLPGSGNERVAATVAQARAYWELVEPMCSSIRIAARWADAATFTTWTAAVRAITSEALKPASGMTQLIRLRALPALCLLVAGGLAAHAQGRWDNVRALAIDTQVSTNGSAPAPLVDVIYPYGPFEDPEWVPNVLARSTLGSSDPATVVELFANRKLTKLRTPIADWLHHVLRSMFEDQFATDDDYDAAFHSTEILFGLLSQDVAIQAVAAGGWRRDSHWFGRSTWQDRCSRVGPISAITLGLKRDGGHWPPLQAGLFGGDIDRAAEAAERFQDVFERVARDRG
ncbi:hypothetical protein C5C95_00200 [Rathayibacter sp. AY1B7]|uniref:toll/interleukin-1 receptor domain-containing protein n=1 Tax=Rathayibacter sp. AY1B7 TaxID=2080532 RepID=UPI000CE8AE9D|nr:toll/interleukin-1 receptor domain-containing protein [Rathayibacter sp. AY1B7]PPI02664.1 hypothetical protein C5C95_00200 [Rathayibacter sp. AY1B7]